MGYSAPGNKNLLTKTLQQAQEVAITDGIVTFWDNTCTFLQLN